MFGFYYCSPINSLILLILPPI